MTITGKRTPDEERAFKRACAEQLLHVGPAKERVVDPYTGLVLFVAPTTQTCSEATCIDGRIYDVRHGIIPCPKCGGGLCPDCGDTGMYVPERAVDDPDFGKPMLCPREGCKAAARLVQERTAKLYAGARLPEGYQECTLDTFRQIVTAYDGLWRGKMLAYHAVEAFIAASGDGYYVDYAAAVTKTRQKTKTPATADTPPVFEDWRNWLVLYGERGVGKTGLMASAVNALASAGQVVRYIRTQSFLKAVQNRYYKNWRDNPPDDEFGDLDSGKVEEVVQRAPVLMLDEFDVADMSENKEGIMENLIRYRHGEKLPTIITTNLDQAGMEERWGPTTVTVIRQRAHWILMSGETMRPLPQVVSEVL